MHRTPLHSPVRSQASGSPVHKMESSRAAAADTQPTNPTSGSTPRHRVEAVGILQQRLVGVEEDTKGLLSQLAQMGFPSPRRQDYVSRLESTVPQLTGPDSRLLATNYEQLVTRVCRTESAVQSLKLSLTRAQAECELRQEQKDAVSERLSNSSDAYDKEVTRLGRELVTARKDLKEGQEERRHAVEELKHIREEFETVVTEKTEAEVKLEDLKATKGKLLRRLTELREAAGREASLRQALEESHATLLTRVQDMEEVVSTEQEEVAKMNQNCCQLKRDYLRAREEAELERSLRLQAEGTVQKLTAQSDGVTTQLAALREDKAYLVTEMNTLRMRYQELISQLDETQGLVAQRQAVHGRLETENQSLHRGVKATAEQNAKLIADYECQLEEMRSDVETKAHGEQLIRELSEQLRVESRAKGQALANCSKLETRIAELAEKAGITEAELAKQHDQHRTELHTLQDTLHAEQHEKETVLHDKDSLLDEVNGTLDGVVEERGRLQAQLAQRDADLRRADQTRGQLEQDVARQRERLGALEEQTAATEQVEKGLGEMMEQTKRLAYDKGRLQSRVQELQTQVATLAATQPELAQLRNATAALEANYTKVTGLERSLSDTQQDNRKVAATLSSVMTSHSQLQLTIEGLQLKLGHRDAQISQLTAGKSEQQNKARQLEKKLENHRSKLVSIETAEASELVPLQAALEQCKVDNAKMAASLESVIQSNASLQASVDLLVDELEKKVFLLEQTQSAREKENAEHELTLKASDQRIDKMQEQLGRDREKVAKRTSKDVSEVRRQLEDLLGKNGELSRGNTELRHKVTDLEYECREQKQKNSAQRAQIDHLTRMRQKQEEALTAMQSVRQQLLDLEDANREYVRKNEQQGKLIERFVAQMSSLQGELQGVMQAQTNMADTLQAQQHTLQAEHARCSELRRKYKLSRKREAELAALQCATEQRLMAAGSESLEVSANLSQAQTWFKTKFDTLQNELTKSRMSQAGLVSENLEQKVMLEQEKKKAEETAEKARQMIKASRKTISRLADYAEVSQRETKSQMLGMQSQLASEKDWARNADAKYRDLRESSLRHTEQLMKELDLLKTSYKPFNSLNSSG